jgi:hypothetical protein
MKATCDPLWPFTRPLPVALDKRWHANLELRRDRLAAGGLSREAPDAGGLGASGGRAALIASIVSRSN